MGECASGNRVPGRALPLTGALNFRDLGGYPTREGATVAYGMVYRSGALHRLTQADFALLDPLGIETVYDLRSHAELECDGVGPWVRDRLHVHVPLVEKALDPFDPAIDWRVVDLRGRYVDMLRVGASAVRSILEGLIRGKRPAVLHCTGGKDRTGIVASVLLRILDVADDLIVSDYALSETYLQNGMAAYREKLVAAKADQAAITYLTASPPDRIASALAELDRTWGSTLGYLDAIGVPRSTIADLRRCLLVR